MDTLLQDIRFGARMLWKHRGATLVGVLTLALGIGATTAIFSVVYGVLLRPLPYAKPDQIVLVWEVNPTGGRMSFADPNFEDIRSQNRSLEGLAEYRTGIESISGGSEPTRTAVAAVSRDFFSVMGIQPWMGRGFAPEDQRFGAAPVALVSYGYWRQYLGSASDPAAVKLRVGNQFATIIGVMPPGFRFPGPDGADVWVPRELFERLPSRTAHNWDVVGRLRDGVTLAQARADLSMIGRQLKRQYGQDILMIDVAVAPLQEAMTRRLRPALILLLAAVGLLLLIACANVANLMLAQAAAREKELAIRTALGAERGRLIRQFLTEALILSLTGGVLGILVAVWGVNVLVAIAPQGLPRLEEVSVSLPVLMFSLGVVLLVALALGISSSLRVTSRNLQGALVEGGQRSAGTLRSQRLGRMVVSGQLATTLVLLLGAGLLGRSLLRVLSVERGFRTEHVVTLDLALSSAEGDADKVRRVQFLDQLLTRLRALPGVDEVGGTARLPLTEPLSDGTYVLMGPGERQPQTIQDLEQLFRNAGSTGDADYCPASEGYFKVLGIPLLRGRLFNDGDTMDAPHVAVISESLAREKWPDRDPLGEKIEFGNMDGDLRLLTVVGVVGDIRANSLEALPRPTIYVDYRQRPQATHHFTAVLRTQAAPAPILRATQEIVRELDPSVPPRFGTFTQTVSASLEARRFSFTLVTAFSVTALLLAMAGIYGVTAYSVARRTREIGVRIALGARPGDILRMIFGQASRTAAVGVAIGLGGSFLLTRMMKSMLFGISAGDPLTFAGVALLLVIAVMGACWIPARRAMRVDPLVSLHYE